MGTFSRIKNRVLGVPEGGYSEEYVDDYVEIDTRKDIGKKSNVTEFKRKRVEDVFFANSQRAKESIRVLEEFTKLFNKRLSQSLKNIRYKIYALEKKIIEGC